MTKELYHVTLSQEGRVSVADSRWAFEHNECSIAPLIRFHYLTFAETAKEAEQEILKRNPNCYQYHNLGCWARKAEMDSKLEKKIRDAQWKFPIRLGHEVL